jgi:hypothetical protein
VPANLASNDTLDTQDSKAMMEAMEEDLALQAAAFGMRDAKDDFNNSFLMTEIARDTSEAERIKREEIEKKSSTLFGKALEFGRHGIRGRVKER